MSSESQLHDNQALQIKYLENITAKVDKIQTDMAETRERVIKIEAKGYNNRIVSLEDKVSKMNDDMVALKTRGAIVASALTVIVGIASAVITASITSSM